MTKQKSLKRRVRARMAKTSESYSTARRQLLAKSKPANRHSTAPAMSTRETTADLSSGPAATAADTGVKPINTSDEMFLRNTGKSAAEWFALLDAWGGAERKHPEIARWLSEQHAVPGWWAQNITVAYEQARGKRVPGQDADGTFSINASKTVAVLVERLFDAFNDKELRERWLPGVKLDVTTANPPKSFRARLGDDGSARLSVGFFPKGEGKSMAGLAVERLPDAEAAKEAKAYWSERMKLLKELLES
jgi:hypothetical protein